MSVKMTRKKLLSIVDGDDASWSLKDANSVVKEINNDENQHKVLLLNRLTHEISVGSIGPDSTFPDDEIVAMVHTDSKSVGFHNTSIAFDPLGRRFFNLLAKLIPGVGSSVIGETSSGKEITLLDELQRPTPDLSKHLPSFFTIVHLDNMLDIGANGMKGGKKNPINLYMMENIYIVATVFEQMQNGNNMSYGNFLSTEGHLSPSNNMVILSVSETGINRGRLEKEWVDKVHRNTTVELHGSLKAEHLTSCGLLSSFYIAPPSPEPDEKMVDFSNVKMIGH